jgi:hypothetical protein
MSQIRRIPEADGRTNDEARSAEMVEGAILSSFRFHIAHLIYPKAVSWQGMPLRGPGIFAKRWAYHRDGRRDHDVDEQEAGWWKMSGMPRRG